MGAEIAITTLIVTALAVLKVVAIIACACGCGVAGYVAWQRKWFSNKTRP
jgi:hypothetical protein